MRFEIRCLKNRTVCIERCENVLQKKDSLRRKLVEGT